MTSAAGILFFNKLTFEVFFCKNEPHNWIATNNQRYEKGSKGSHHKAAALSDYV